MPPTTPCRLYTALTLAAIGGAPAWAYDVNDRLELNLLAAGAIQCQQVAGDTEAPNVCRGGGILEPEVLFKPTEQDQLFAKFGFGLGNGLNNVSPFVLAPWAAGLEDDVRHINGRDRNYLLEAWYAHTFRFASDHSVQITGGIIDTAFYVDENAYANNEYTQFMNEAFVNARSTTLPSYDWGGVLVWKWRHLTLSGVGMNVGENEDGRNFNWYALEADLNVAAPWGEGNYRVMYSGTSRAYLAPAPGLDPPPNPDLVPGLDLDPATEPEQGHLQRLSVWTLSFDQALGKVIGVFLRMGWQKEDALVDYQAEYSGGFNFNGAAWRREADNIGIGYAYLAGGNTDLARTNVAEAYYRLVATHYLALTGDVQYMQDDYRTADDIEGWIFSLRAVIEF